METVAEIPELAVLPDAVATVAPRPADAPSRLADFYELTKPRMNFLVVVTTMVGFFMGMRPGFVDWVLLVHCLLGTAMAAAGASVLNQYVERGYDALMLRTADRPLPAGRVTPVEALLFGVLLSAGGSLYLAALVNPLTAALGAITIVTYVFLYTPMKRWTPLCTVVGAVPGAIPPMMGWAAVTDSLSPEAWALFGILFFWQMPHFLAIAVLYRDDYSRGGFKMLPVVDEHLVMTGRQTVLYGMALVPVSLLPVAVRMAGAGYLLAAVVMGLAFLGFGINCAVRKRRVDARSLFLASIVYLPALLAVMMLDKKPWVG
jgi:protoheme IX farnesyltransferase